MVEKKKALEEKPEGFENRLFFQARNLAIEVLLLKLEKKIVSLGYNNVEINWIESSFGAPRIEFKYHNTNKSASWEYATVYVSINREKIKTFHSDLSGCYYSFKELCVTEYWRGKQPKKLLDFREDIKILGENFFKEEIEKVNYPFDKKGYSVY